MHYTYASDSVDDDIGSTSPSVDSMMIFAGGACSELAKKVCKGLNRKPSRAVLSCYSDGEQSVEILDNVRGRDVYIIQSTCKPTDVNLMQLLVMVDALRRASVRMVTAVIPYFGYGRQDRRILSQRVPITAKLVANMLSSAGVSRVLTMDLHSDQIQGFFDIPVDNMYATSLLASDIWKQGHDNLVVVSPDAGGLTRARAVSKYLDNADLAIIDKRRLKPNQAEAMNVIGDVAGRTCVLVDDMIDTAGTLCVASKVLKERGACGVYAYATHAVLSGRAVEKITDSALDSVVITDTIELGEESKACGKIRQLSVANILAEAMRRIQLNESVSTVHSV